MVKRSIRQVHFLVHFVSALIPVRQIQNLARFLAPNRVQSSPFGVETILNNFSEKNRYHFWLILWSMVGRQFPSIRANWRICLSTWIFRQTCAGVLPRESFCWRGTPIRQIEYLKDNISNQNRQVTALGQKLYYYQHYLNQLNWTAVIHKFHSLNVNYRISKSAQVNCSNMKRIMTNI